MQFQVPQFIEVEDKIFGDLTFKQFLYVLGGLGAAYLAYRAFPLYAAIPFMIAGAGGGAALAFMRYNGRPLILALEYGFYYYLRSKLYLWNNARSVPEKEILPTPPEQGSNNLYVPRLSDSKLKELSWSLDINEKIKQGAASDSGRERAERISSLIAPVRTSRDALVR